MKRLAHLADSYLYYFILAIVLVMPFHAFMAISLGQLTGQQTLIQAWKEVGLVLAGVAAGIIVVSQPKTRNHLIRQPAVWSAALFIVVALVVSLLNQSVGIDSFLLGAKTTLAFLVLFLVAQTIRFTPQRWTVLIKSLLAVSSAIGLFAMAQVYLLPPDWLARFGYSPTTVIPFHLVDPAVASIRIIGTFSGPNQLGSFMIIPFILSFWFILRKQWLAIIPYILTGFALFNSYSRSAWIGALVATFVVLFIRLRRWWKLTLIIPMAALAMTAVILSGPVKAMTTDLTFYVFHGQFIDGHTNGSDSYRLENAEYGLQKITEQPLGYGLGTAGPASKNEAQPIITENSYLQVGIETGIAGLLMFGLTIALTLAALYSKRTSVDESMALFAILLGLSVTNLFLHTWADSATALLLWALMGYCLAASKRGKA